MPFFLQQWYLLQFLFQPLLLELPHLLFKLRQLRNLPLDLILFAPVPWPVARCFP